MNSILSTICHGLGLKGAQDKTQAYRLILFVTLFRTAYLFFFPLGFVGDESYYWEWGRNLDWGYYSKPPFIGWLMGALTWAGLNGAAELRIAAALFSGFTLLIFYHLGLSLFEKRIAFWAVVFLLFTPAISAMSLIITIDAPLLFFWSLSMLAFWKVFYEKKSALWIFILIFSLGFGNLTKQMMLLFPLLGAITLLFDPAKRYLLIKPWIWLGWLGTLVFLFPPIWWNWDNDWITLRHTASHINQSQFNLKTSLLSFLEFLVSETFILGPVLFWGGIYSLYKLFRLKNRESKINFLLIFSLPAILLFIVLSFTQKVNPNWPAVFYLPMVLLCSFYLTKKTEHKANVYLKDYKSINLITSVLLLCIIYFSVFSIDLLGLKGSKYDLFKRLRGYEDYAKQVMDVHQSISKNQKTEIIVIGHRYDLCQLAFAGAGQPRVHGYWEKNQQVNDQYDIWAQKKELGRTDSLIVCSTSEKIPLALINKYQKIQKLDKEIRIFFPVGKQHLFDLYHAFSKK